MKFFIPYTNNDNERNEAWKVIKSLAEETIGWKVTDKKIYRIDFRHDGKEWIAEVGKGCRRLEGEVVVAILETDNRCYLICTKYRGVQGGQPVMVGVLDTKEIVLFDH